MLTITRCRRFALRHLAKVRTLYLKMQKQEIDECYAIVRVSDNVASTTKAKLPGFTKYDCVTQLVDIFGSDKVVVFADCVNDELIQSIRKLNVQVIETENSSGGVTFIQALQFAITLPEKSVAYLVEDDYMHLKSARKLILEGINLGLDYVSLYDHPDKYDGHTVVNPSVRFGELTRVLLSNSTHWKLTDSTTMTFAATVRTLMLDANSMETFCTGRQPQDYDMFLRLRSNGRTIGTCLPAAATHCEVEHLSPLLKWSSGKCDS